MVRASWLTGLLLVAVGAAAAPYQVTRRPIAYTGADAGFQGWSEVSLSPDGRLVAFVDEREAEGTGNTYDLVVATIHGQRLVTRRGYFQTPRWSPGGKRLGYLSDLGLCTMRPDGSDAGVRVRHRTSYDWSWSPDGRHLAFLRHGDLWVADPDGQHQRCLLRGKERLSYAWARDGRHLTASHDQVYVQEKAWWQTPRAWLITLATGRASLVTSPSKGQRVADCGLSPDGGTLALVCAGSYRKTAYGARRDLSLWLRDLATGAARRVTTDTGEGARLLWSPDGSRLAWCVALEGGCCGGEQRFSLWSAAGQRLSGAIKGYPKQWSPGGKRLLFGRHSDGCGHNDYVCDHVGQRVTLAGVMGDGPGGSCWLPDGLGLLVAHGQSIATVMLGP
jgi:Tol biopolymer transport system component